MWSPITSENALERLSAAHEREVLDLKIRYEVDRRPKIFELAKDIAAFANHLGGSIIVGAAEGSGEDKGRLVALPGLSTTPSPGQVISAVGTACTLCLPVPIAEGLEIELSPATQQALVGRGGPTSVRVVIINVPPMLTPPVGAFVCRDDGTRVDDAYRFPVRTVEGTRFLRPEELVNLMNSHERRILLQLTGLTPPAPVLLWCNAQNGDRRLFRQCEVVSVDPALMVANLRHVVDGKEHSAEVPLTFVRALWPSSKGWNLAIDGHAFDLDVSATQHLGFVPPGGILVR